MTTTYILVRYRLPFAQLSPESSLFAAPAFSVGINIFSSSFKAMHQERKKFVVVNSDDVMRVLRKTKTIRMLK